MSTRGLFGSPDVEQLRATGDVDGLIKATSYRKDARVRLAAARALGEVGGPRAVAPLITALRDLEEAVCVAAMEALGQIGDSQAVLPLLATLECGLPDERWGAARALGEIGDLRAVEPLIAALQDKFSRVRVAAVQALGKIGDARAVKPLIAVREEDSDPMLSESVTEALNTIYSPWTTRSATAGTTG